MIALEGGVGTVGRVKRLSLGLALAMSAALLTACGGGGGGSTTTSAAPVAAKKRVVVTNSILADFVAVVGASLVDIKVLVPQNADPRTYVLTSDDVTAVTNADLVIKNGLGLEPWLDEFQKTADLRGRVATVSAGVTPRMDENNVVDPFIWVSPSNGRVMVSNVRTALEQLIPESAVAFQASERAYDASMDNAIAYARRVTEPVKQRQLVYVGEPLGYYCDEFQLLCKGVSVADVTRKTPASPAEVNKLLASVRDAKAAAIVVGADVPNSIVDSIRSNAVNTTRARVTSGADSLTVRSVGDASTQNADYLTLQRDIADLLSANLR